MEDRAVFGPAWGQGLSGHGRHYELARGDSIPSCRSLFASPLESEGVFLLKDSALRKRGEDEEQEEEVGGEREEEEERRRKKKTTSGENEDEHADCENVQELSDLFSSIESEASGDHAIDFSVLLEGEHAFNVEEVSEIFSDLEDVAVNEQDAQCVDDVAALFTALQEQDTDAESDSDSAQDAENVDELSELFSALEEQDTADEQAHEDWIASLDVDHVSSLFTELEELQQREEEEVKSQVPTAVAVPPPTVAVDPRIFVPSQSVRMEGRRMPVAMALPRVSAGARLDTSAFLVGPPCLRAGPPVLMAEKRKLSESSCPISRPADPIISETRRASAAKRRRVNGRFVREQNAFVSITQLQ